MAAVEIVQERVSMWVRSRIIFVALSLGLLMAASAPAPAEQRILLSYAPRPATSWATEFDVSVDVPFHDRRSLSVVYNLSSTSEGDAPFLMAAFVARTHNPYYDVPIGPFQASFTLAATGKVTSLRSQELRDPYQGTFAENLRSFFLPLPDRSVGLGERWHWEAVVYIPAPKYLDVLQINVPGRIPILGTSYVWEIIDGHIAKIVVSARHAPGSSVEAELDGHVYFDTKRGILVSGNLEGKFIKRKRIIIEFTVQAPLVLSFQVPGAYTPKGTGRRAGQSKQHRTRVHTPSYHDQIYD